MQAVTSSLISNTWSRNLHSIRYTVEPTDSTNAAQTAQTEALLKNLDDIAEVIPKRTADGVAVWLLKSDNAELEDVLRGLEGVSYVEKEVSSELTRRAVLKYIVSAMESGNIEDTEAFLDSKIQSGTKYRRILDDDETTVLGWANVTLDEEAANAVEEHEGIEYPLGIDEVTLK
jgi:hypothetical protein